MAQRIVPFDETGQPLLAVVAPGKMIGIDRLALSENTPLVALNAGTEGVIRTDSKEQVGAFPLPAAVKAVALMLTRDAFEERSTEAGDLAGPPQSVLDHALQSGGDWVFVHRCERLTFCAQNLQGTDQYLVKDDEHLRLQLGVGKLGRRGIAGVAPLLLEGAGHFWGRDGRKASRWLWITWAAQRRARVFVHQRLWEICPSNNPE